MHDGAVLAQQLELAERAMQLVLGPLVRSFADVGHVSLRGRGSLSGVRVRSERTSGAVYAALRVVEREGFGADPSRQHAFGLSRRVQIPEQAAPSAGSDDRRGAA